MINLCLKQTYTVYNQGSNITPCNRQVTVHWFDSQTVHYTLDGLPELYETTVSRFLEIINQS